MGTGPKRMFTPLSVFVCSWLQADIQSPEIEVCSYPNNRHSAKVRRATSEMASPTETLRLRVVQDLINESAHELGGIKVDCLGSLSLR